MKNFAIVVSDFNAEVTEKLLEGALQQFEYYDVDQKKLVIARVPGAVEIPLAAQRLLEKKPYHAVVCLGAVIRGETNHYDYVCQMVSQGCMQVMLKYHTPIIFGVLTTETEEQALARAGGAHGNKGKDAVDAAMKM